MFNTIIIKNENDNYQSALSEINPVDLPEGDVIVAVEYSTLNYKDALAICGKAPIIRQFPMVPGIDFAGTVLESQSDKFTTGDKVVLNGWGVGEKHWGGLSQQACVKAEWLVPLPERLTTQQTMMIGTAGYTAMLCVLALEEQGVRPEHGEILVTGAAGGVGSVAIAILSKLGFDVVALSGRSEEADYLKGLGAKAILARQTMSEAGKPLAKERWAGVVDVAGSHVLANACASTQYGGVVTACGLAAGMDLPATVAPFILRSVKLIGIDSVMCPYEKRVQAWQRLATDLALNHLDTITKTIGLSDVIDAAHDLLANKIRGRILVDVNR